MNVSSHCSLASFCLAVLVDGDAVALASKLVFVGRRVHLYEALSTLVAKYDARPGGQTTLKALDALVYLGIVDAALAQVIREGVQVT